MTEARTPDSLSGLRALAFFTADHAAVVDGKAYINGAFFNRINQPAYPAQISIAIVALLEAPPEAFLQDHQFAIEMVDGQGDRLPTPVRIEGNLRAAPSPDLKQGESMKMPLAVPLDGLIIERVGDYMFLLFINEDEVARYEIQATQVGIIAQPFTQAPSGDSDATQDE
jgi:hypothetical protein